MDNCSCFQPLRLAGFSAQVTVWGHQLGGSWCAPKTLVAQPLISTVESYAVSLISGTATLTLPMQYGGPGGLTPPPKKRSFAPSDMTPFGKQPCLDQNKYMRAHSQVPFLQVYFTTTNTVLSYCTSLCALLPYYHLSSSAPPRW